MKHSGVGREGGFKSLQIFLLNLKMFVLKFKMAITKLAHIKSSWC